MDTTSPASDKPFVTFDTTVHNRFAEGVVPESTLVRIRETRHVRLAGLSVEEMVATSDAGKREKLFRCCELITEESEEHSDTLLPHNALLEALVLAHWNVPGVFDWQAVDVRAHAYHQELRNRSIVLEGQLAAEQRVQQSQMLKQYRQTFTKARPAIQNVFLDNGTPHPRTFREALAGMEEANQKHTISLCKAFYDKVTRWNISREGAREFMASCPPMQLILYSTLMSQYDLAMRDRHHGERFDAGRNDLFMSVYLPYCNEFVTEDAGQARCLRELAAVAGIQTEVLSLAEFINRMQP